MLAGIGNRKSGIQPLLLHFVLPRRRFTVKVRSFQKTLDGQRSVISGMLDYTTYLEYVENCYETCAQFIKKIPSVIFCHLLLKKIPVSLLRRFLRVCPEMHVERVNFHFEFRSNGWNVVDCVIVNREITKFLWKREEIKVVESSRLVSNWPSSFAEGWNWRLKPVGNEIVARVYK